MNDVKITLNPTGREEIHRLEIALLLETLLRTEVIQLLKDPSGRLTWVDSLAVAAGAIARERAKMTVSQIAEELGRTEATIRNHLAGKTKAGQLVRQTLQKFIKEGVKIEIGIPIISEEELEKLKKLEEEKKKLENILEKVKKTLKELLAEL
ncbi:MAG: transcriptional regulator [Candidatus Methanomethylicota archaeon]|nr:MAG: transcriptional regulator [Candidatus Verstraetearchaeota archaeon]